MSGGRRGLDVSIRHTERSGSAHIRVCFATQCCLLRKQEPYKTTPATPERPPSAFPFPVYHLQVKPISRSDGRSATAAAAYRSAQLIVDARTGEVHDYEAKGDVVHSELALPAGAPAWANDRSALWNAAEAAEKRKDARVARDYEVAIPKELSFVQGIDLVRDFAHELVERYGVAVDFNVHKDDLRSWDGTAKGWQGYHAHILSSTRRLGPDGFGAKAAIELGDRDRKAIGLGSGAAEISLIRERWEIVANRHLEQAGVLQRIDRRSLKDQGIDRDPTVHLGPEVTALERKGVTSRLGDLNRQAALGRQLDAEKRGVEQGLQVLGEQRDAARARDEKRRQAEQRQAEQSRVERLRRQEEAQQRHAEQAKEQATQAPALSLEESKAALVAAVKQKYYEREQRLKLVLLRAQQREARRQPELRWFIAHQPQPPTGWVTVPAAVQKGYEETLKAWEKSRAAVARLAEQARRLVERLLEAAQPQRLIKWAQDYLRRERPELVAPVRAEQEAKARVTAESQPEGSAPAKRDWNRYKTLQQDLAKQGVQSLQQRGVVRDPNAPEPDPPELIREKKPDRGRSR